MLNETSVNCFLTLAETLNFTKTAKLLFMTQQSVSKHIARLEGELGFPLFERNHHYVALTPAGERCREMFSRFRQEFRTVVEESRAQYGHLSHLLRVGYLEWLHLGDAPAKALKLLQDEVPEVELVTERYAYGTLSHLLREGDLNLIVTYESFASQIEGVEHATLLQIPMVILISPHHPKAVEGARWTDFEGETFLCAANENESVTDTEKRARRDIKRLRIPGCPIQVCPNRESAFAAAEMGQGLLLSTPLSLVTRGYGLNTYETDEMESLVCMWRRETENGLADCYARCLRQAYGVE